MLGRRATPERRAQLAQQALAEIKGLRARLVLVEMSGPPGLLGRLVRRVARVALDRWERLERRALKG